MQKIRCVVVDDEHLNRELICMLVSDSNAIFEITATASGVNEAEEIIRRVRPDLVFLDIKMPDGNGFELLARFPPGSFAVVFITGFDEYVLETFQFNTIDYILKPIDLEKLNETLNRVISLFEGNVDRSFAFGAKYWLGGELSKIPVAVSGSKQMVKLSDISVVISLSDTMSGFVMKNGTTLLSDARFIHYKPVFEYIPEFICVANKIIVREDDYKEKFSQEISDDTNPRIDRFVLELGKMFDLKNSR